MNRVYSGRCLCGSVVFEVSGEATNRCYCHCRSCQRASGAPAVAWATFPLKEWVLQRGVIRIIQSSEKVSRSFCAQCGTTLTYQHEEQGERLDVAVATLDEPQDLVPTFHIWVSEKFPGTKLNDHLPQYPEWRS